MPTSIDKFDLFGERSCLSLNEIKDYTAKRLDENHMHNVESHLTTCELCNDAVEGYMAIPAFDLSSDLGRRGRGSGHWTNGLAKGVVVVAVLLAGYWFVDHFTSTPIASINETDTVEEGVVLYDPEEELVQLNEEVENAEEIPMLEQVGHEANALISVPATNEKPIKHIGSEAVEEPLPIVRDTTNMAVNISPQIPEVARITPEAPRPKLKRLPVSNRELLYLNRLKLVHPSEIYGMLNPRPALGGTRAGQTTIQDEGILRVKHYTYTEVLEMATEAYWKENHKEAAKMLNLWLSKHPKDVNCQFYVGLCYYNLGLYEKAYKNFENAKTNKIDTFKEEATWYSALSHEQINGLEATKVQYERISLLGGFYSDRAFEKIK